MFPDSQKKKNHRTKNLKKYNQFVRILEYIQKIPNENLISFLK